MVDLDSDFARVRTIIEAKRWPGMEVGLAWGTPGAKVRGKFLLRIREPDVLVMLTSMDDKLFLLEFMPEIYFQTDHYKGWSGVLIRLSKITDEELEERIDRGWRQLASKKQIAEYDAQI